MAENETRRIEGFGSIEVYYNKAGHIVIKQEGYMGEDDAVVTFPPVLAPKMCEWIQEVAQEAVEVGPSEEKDSE